MRQVRVVGATLMGLLLAGCSGAGNPPSDDSGHTTASSPAAPTAPRSASPVSGPWRTWTAPLSVQEKRGPCGATAHQVVCATSTGGLVGRSRTTGEVTWVVPGTGKGKSAALVLDAADERAVTGVGRVLATADLRTGKAAWSHRLPADRAYFGIHAADGIVHTLDARSATLDGDVLTAFRTSDGKPLWHRTVEDDATAGIASFGGRVYTTDGTRVTARDARTGKALATSPEGTECPQLWSGGHYLVCTGSPISAGDTFPPLQRLDPVSLKPLPTAEDTGEKPERALISADGVLVLYEDSAEDPGAGDWNAYDLVRGRRLWSYYTTTEEAALADGRFVTFTPGNDKTNRGRVITIDLHAGPKATGTAAPRMSPPYPQTRRGEYPLLAVPGGDAGLVIVQAQAHLSLRSVPLP